MPIIKSAIKRMRQTISRRARNLKTKRSVRTALKSFTAEKTIDNLSKAQSELDKAVKKNLLSKNTAARKKAQLAKAAKEAGATITKKSVAKKAEKPTAETEKKTAKSTKKPAAKKGTTKKTDK